jgi:septal ring factor EnvC (AmiA/AmiB activator)
MELKYRLWYIRFCLSGGKNLKIKHAASALLAMALFMGPQLALAQTLDGAKQQLGATNQKIQELQAAANEHTHAAETLEGQIAAMDAEMATIRRQIAVTQGQIAATNVEIAKAEAQMAAKKDILKQYIRSQYYNPYPTTFESLVSSGDLSEFMDNREYLGRVQKRMEAMIAEVQKVKAELDGKKAELGKLSDQLAGQQAGLDAQRAAKSQLLAQTRGEEAKYKAMLAEAEAARQRLSSTIAKLMGNGPMVSKGYVERGQVIGREGSTGFSTGPHVHFGIYSGGAAVNPWPYLNNGRVGWPLANFTMTQNYGPAGWVNSNYTFHDGLDLSQYYGAPVLAACSGNIIMNSFQPGGFGHYIVIDCGGGIWALAAHMQ